jgi:hypothetical protein
MVNLIQLKLYYRCINVSLEVEEMAKNNQTAKATRTDKAVDGLDTLW